MRRVLEFLTRMLRDPEPLTPEDLIVIRRMGEKTL